MWQTWGSDRKACQTDDRPQTPRWRSRMGDNAVPVCVRAHVGTRQFSREHRAWPGLFLSCPHSVAGHHCGGGVSVWPAGGGFFPLWSGMRCSHLYLCLGALTCTSRRWFYLHCRQCVTPGRLSTSESPAAGAATVATEVTFAIRENGSKVAYLSHTARAPSGQGEPLYSSPKVGGHWLHRQVRQSAQPPSGQLPWHTSNPREGVRVINYCSTELPGVLLHGRCH